MTTGNTVARLAHTAVGNPSREGLVTNAFCRGSDSVVWCVCPVVKCTAHHILKSPHWHCLLFAVCPDAGMLRFRTMTTTILASMITQATSLSLCGGQPRSWAVPSRRAPGAAWLCAGGAAGV